MNAETNQTKELSPEEIQTLINQQLQFYKERTEFLEVQLKYETLLADVEEQQLRQLVAKVRQAQILAPQEAQSPQTDPTSPGEKRTLKKD